jgi:hypothetical protein
MTAACSANALPSKHGSTREITVGVAGAVSNNVIATILFYFVVVLCKNYLQISVQMNIGNER